MRVGRFAAASVASIESARAGAGFDWLAVTGLGRAAMKYYGPGGPGARPLLLAAENPTHVKLGR